MFSALQSKVSLLHAPPLGLENSNDLETSYFTGCLSLNIYRADAPLEPELGINLEIYVSLNGFGLCCVEQETTVMVWAHIWARVYV